MATVTETLNLARAQLGYIEQSDSRSGNITKYGEWYGMNRQPWCAMANSWVFAHSGVGDQYRHASVAESLARARREGRHTGEFRAGYVVCRINDGGWTGPGHTGLIEAVHADESVTTLEGNTSPGSGGSQRDGGGYWRRRRPKSYWNRQCIRINYTKVPDVPKPPAPERWGKFATPMVGGFWKESGMDHTGMYLIGADGGVFALGPGATFHGSTGGVALNRPVVGGAPHPSGAGYWLVADDGGVFCFGNAKFHGSTGGQHLNRPVVGMAATPSGNGYWLVGADGGVFTYGDAQFHGSIAQVPLNRPVVGIIANKSGNGYWLIGEDGGVFALGDATYSNSALDRAKGKRIVSMAVTASERGYWLLCEDGSIIPCGDAQDWQAGKGNAYKATQLLADDKGLLVVYEDGSIYSAGPGPIEFWGSVA